MVHEKRGALTKQILNSELTGETDMTDTELGKVARDAYYHADNNSVWESIAKAVKEQVLADLHEQESTFIAGQELTYIQVAQWVKKYGSTEGLEVLEFSGIWSMSLGINDSFIEHNYRVPPKKVNDPTDPTTWKVGTPVFCWDSVREYRVPKMFAEYLPERYCKFKTQDDYVFYNAELATPEQVAAWHVLNS